MELDRSSVLDRLQSRTMSKTEFDFDRLSAPPLYSMIDQASIDKLYTIATSVRYSGNPALKLKMISDIMKPLGFVKLSGGTNRVVYKCLENDTFVLKIAMDAVGMSDNPAEFRNQHIFKPFVAKMFEVDPTGVVGVMERVIPITSREEFESVGNDIFSLINDWLIGKYVLADFGTKFFMNYGIRRGMGPVLLDYPYVYELDGEKLYCCAPNINNPTGRCEGVIDYDDGFNYLHCTKCGTKYRVRELAKSIQENNVIVKGRRKTKMKVGVMINGSLVTDAGENDGLLNGATAKIEKKPEIKPTSGLQVSTTYVDKKPKGNKNRPELHRGRVNKPNNGIITPSNKPSNIKIEAAQQNRPPKVVEAQSCSVNGGTLELHCANNHIVTFTNDGVMMELLKMGRRNDCFTDEVRAIIKEIYEESEDYAKLLQEIHVLEENSISYKKELERLYAIEKSLNEELLDVKTEYKSDLEELKLAKEEIVRLRECQDKQIKLSNEVDVKANEVVDKNEKLQNRIDELEETIRVKDECILELECRNTELEDANSRLEKEIISDVEKSEVETSDRVSSLQSDLDAAKKTIADLERQINENNEDMDNMSALNEELYTKLKSAEDQLAITSELLSEANSKLDSVGKPQALPYNYDTNKVYNFIESFSGYAHITPISGKVITINQLLSENQIEYAEDHNIIVFEDGAGGFFTDQEGIIISLVAINGKPVDKLFEIVGDEEEDITGVEVDTPESDKEE